MGGEDHLFSSGNKRLVFTFRGVRISPYICYDLRFPVWSRNRNDYDLIIYAANWPEVRRDVWNTLLKARAIENQCYVLSSAQGGTHINHRRTWGNTMLINSWGDVLANLPEGEGFITGTLSKDKLKEVIV